MYTLPQELADEIITELFKMFEKVNNENSWEIFKWARAFINSLVINKNNCTLVPTDKLKAMQAKIRAYEITIPFEGIHDHMCPCGKEWLTSGQADVRTTKRMINKWCDETIQPNEVLEMLEGFWDWSEVI